MDWRVIKNKVLLAVQEIDPDWFTFVGQGKELHIKVDSEFRIHLWWDEPREDMHPDGHPNG